MAQIRQSKFKVNSYKLFRKSYVLAVIHKLKPFINERYAQYLLEESKKVHDPDNFDSDVPQSGALLQNQLEKTDNFIASTIEPFKPFWQGRKGPGPTTPLSTMGDSLMDTTTSLTDSSSDSSQIVERNASGTKDMEVMYPIWHSVSNLPVSNLSDSIIDCLAPSSSSDGELPLAKFVVVRPAPRIGHRAEIDMTTIDRLLSRPIYLKYLSADGISNRNESTSTLDLSDRMHLQDIDRPDIDSLKTIDCTPCSDLARKPKVSFSVTDKFLTFVLTYLAVFCIIGFLFVFLP